jgi:hypothetical protein
MKDRFLVVTSSHNSTIYIPLSRLLRIEAIPAHGQGTASVIAIIFEGYQVNVQTSLGAEAKVAQDLYERLVRPEDVDLVYLRPDAEKGVNDIRIGSDTGLMSVS